MKPFLDLVTIADTPSAWYPIMYNAIKEIHVSFFERLCASEYPIFNGNYPYSDGDVWQQYTNLYYNVPISSINLDIPSGTNLQSYYNYKLITDEFNNEYEYSWDYAGIYKMQLALLQFDGGLSTPLNRYYSPLDTSVSGDYFVGNTSDFFDYRYTDETFFNSLSSRKSDGTIQKWRGLRRCNGDTLPIDWTDVNDPAFTPYYVDDPWINGYGDGYVTTGDIFGPWIIDDLQLILSNMTIQAIGNSTSVSAVNAQSSFSTDIYTGAPPVLKFAKGVWYDGAWNHTGTILYPFIYYHIRASQSTGGHILVTKGKVHLFNIPSNVPYKLKFYQQFSRTQAFAPFYEPNGYVTAFDEAQLLFETDWRTGESYTHPTIYGDGLIVTIDTPKNDASKGGIFSGGATMIVKNNAFTYGNISTSVEFPDTIP